MRKNGEGLKITTLSGNRCKSKNKEYHWSIEKFYYFIDCVLIYIIILLRYFSLTVMNNVKIDSKVMNKKKLLDFPFLCADLILRFCRFVSNHVNIIIFKFTSAVFLCVSNTFRINPQRMLLRILRWI